jgi:S1-C subfamily serine protease
VSAGVVLTAWHVVEPPLRMLTVDGRPASIAAADRRLDLAIVVVTGAAPISAAALANPRIVANDDAVDGSISGQVAILGPSTRELADALRVVTLRVEDVTRGVVNERRSLVLDTALDRGSSGSPVVDASGDLVGVVVLSDPSNGPTYATLIPSLEVLVEEKRLEHQGGCA